MNVKDSLPRILHLAAVINASVTEIKKTLDSQGIPLPSFDENAPSLPQDISQAQDAVLDATAELHDLLMDPFNMLHRVTRVIARFDIANLVPPNGSLSFKEIANQTPLTEQMVARIVRHAAMMRVFHEPVPGKVAHTRASRILASSQTRDWLLTGVEELGPAGSMLASALEKWPGSQEPNETGFALANNTEKSIYDVIAASPERAVRFANAMKVMTSRPQFDLSYATDYYNWNSLGAAQVVDVGGAKGHFAIALARKYKDLRIMVQDMAFVVDDADAGDLKDRVEFMAHDLFETQTVHADVFFFRWIFHNWPDRYCIRIIQAQVPVMKHGTRLIIQEVILPQTGAVPSWKESNLRSMDLEMAYTFNARERTIEDWKALLKEADPGFVIRNVIEPEDSAMGMLEVVWEGVR